MRTLYLRPAINAFPALKDGDFFCKRPAFRPGLDQSDMQDILRRIHVSVVRRPTVGARPMPHSEHAHTFRTAVGDAPAARACLGRPPLVDLNVRRAMP